MWHVALTGVKAILSFPNDNCVAVLFVSSRPQVVCSNEEITRETSGVK